MRVRQKLLHTAYLGAMANCIIRIIRFVLRALIDDGVTLSQVEEHTSATESH